MLHSASVYEICLHYFYLHQTQSTFLSETQTGTWSTKIIAFDQAEILQLYCIRPYNLSLVTSCLLTVLSEDHHHCCFWCCCLSSHRHVCTPPHTHLLLHASIIWEYMGLILFISFMDSLYVGSNPCDSLFFF